MTDNDQILRGSVLERLNLAEHDAEERDWRSGANELARIRKYVEALPAVTVGVKALVWATDGRKLHMDQTMAFSKSYDWDGWDCFRQEGYGLGSSYIIWPDSIGSARWNLYGTVDGLFITDLNGESAAKAAAQSDYTARILAALEPAAPDPAAIREAALRDALTLAANRLHRCSVDYDTGSREFIEVGEWATEARLALIAKGAAE